VSLCNFALSECKRRMRWLLLNTGEGCGRALQCEALTHVAPAADDNTRGNAHTHVPHARARAHTPRARARARARAHTHPHARARAHTRTHTHAHAHTRQPSHSAGSPLRKDHEASVPLPASRARGGAAHGVVEVRWAGNGLGPSLRALNWRERGRPRVSRLHLA